MPTRPTLLLTASLSLAGSLAFPASAAHADPGCGVPGLAVRAVPDQRFNRAWADYGNDNSLSDDWTGADSSYSVALPDGRVVWLFSDTYLGKVGPEGGRPLSSPLINNSFVIERGRRLARTLHGGTAERPTALAVPTDASWYWTGDATVEGDSLRQFLPKFTRTGPGAWDWYWSGTDIGTYSLPGLELVRTTPAPSSNGVMYGSAVLEEDDFTYIYGSEDLQLVKYLHVARAPAGDLLGPWEFFDGSGWSSNPAASVRLMAGVDNGIGVVQAGQGYVLFTFDTKVIFGNEIVAYASCSPAGPWTNRTHVYSTPEQGPDLFSYGATVHPEFTRAGSLLLSYNVNTFEPLGNYRDVTVYRPRFLRVSLSA